MTNSKPIDSVGFCKGFVAPPFSAFNQHMLNLGAEVTLSSRLGSLVLNHLYTDKSIIEDLYPFVILPRAVDLSSKREFYLMGGYTPCGRAHLGSLLHITAMNLARNAESKTISFNDLDSKTSIRRVAKSVEIEAMKSFERICDRDFRFVKRTEDPRTFAFYNELQARFDTEVMKSVLGREISEDERKSLNIQAAAYLEPQLHGHGHVVGFDGLEEAARASWINYVAASYKLPGFINFISFQVPGFEPELKMGKSNEEGSISVGDSRTSVINRLLDIAPRQECLLISFITDLLIRRGKSLSGIRAYANRDYLDIYVDLREARGLYSNRRLLAEDWILILMRARSSKLWKERPESFKPINRFKNTDSLIENLFGENLQNCNFGKLLYGARLLANLEVSSFTERGLLIHRYRRSDINQVWRSAKEYEINASDLYNFLNDPEPELRLDIFVAAAIETICVGDKKSFFLS